MADEDRVGALIIRHLERRPQMRATDIYKLLYQGVFGVGHLLGEEARSHLKSEAESLHLDEQLKEPLIEEVSIDGSMIRINLRPYIRRGLSLDRLFSAMEASAHAKGRVEDFFEVWSTFKGLVSSGRLAFDGEEIEELDRELELVGCRPRHHSVAYRRTYAPAYRVVKLEAIEWMFDAEELGDERLD